MKKIGFLINSLGKGGAERVVLNLAQHFYRQGYEVLLVTSRRMPNEYAVGFPAKRRMLEEEAARAAKGRLSRIPARILALRRIWREEKPQVIVSFIGKLNLYAMLSSRGLSIPVFLSVRSDPAREYPSALQYRLACMLFCRAGGVAFQTREAMEYFPPKVRARARVLGNPLDVHFLKARYEGERRDEIVMAGRLDANKNHAMAIRAFARLCQDFPEEKLVIYGAGVEGSDTEPELRRLTAELGVSGQVVFAGVRENLYECMERSRIFVLASFYEGMPNALLEAMALGLCVIATDCPCYGPRAVIEDGKNGLLIPVGDEEALTEALRKVLENPALAETLGKNAGRIQKRLEPERVCGEWQAWIEDGCKNVSGKS